MQYLLVLQCDNTHHTKSIVLEIDDGQAVDDVAERVAFGFAADIVSCNRIPTRH